MGGQLAIAMATADGFGEDVRGSRTSGGFATSMPLWCFVSFILTPRPLTFLAEDMAAALGVIGYSGVRDWKSDVSLFCVRCGCGWEGPLMRTEMAKAEQIEALLRCYAEDDDTRFYAVAVQIARSDGNFVQEQRDLIGSAWSTKTVSTLQASCPVPLAQSGGDLVELLTVTYLEQRALYGSRGGDAC